MTFRQIVNHNVGSMSCNRKVSGQYRAISWPTTHLSTLFDGVMLQSSGDVTAMWGFHKDNIVSFVDGSLTKTPTRDEKTGGAVKLLDNDWWLLPLRWSQRSCLRGSGLGSFLSVASARADGNVVFCSLTSDKQRVWMRCRDDQHFHFVRPVGVVAVRDILIGETLLALDTLRNTVVLQPRPSNDKFICVQVSGDISAGVSHKDIQLSHRSDNNAEWIGPKKDASLEPSKRQVDLSMIAILTYLLQVRQPDQSPSTPRLFHFRLPTFLHVQRHPHLMSIHLSTGTLHQVSDVKVSICLFINMFSFLKTL